MKVLLDPEGWGKAARQRRWRRRRRVFGLVLLLAALGLLTLWWKLGFDAPEEFWEQKGDLVRADIDTLEGDAAYAAYHLQLASSTGQTIRGHLRVPRQEGSWPSIIVMGGVGTGRMAAELITPDDPYVVLGLDYPWEGSTRLSPFQFTVHIVAIREAMLETPSAVMLAIDYLRAHPSVDRSGPVLVGASFGAQLMTVAGALDERAGPVLSVYGGGDFAALLYHNLDVRPEWLRSGLAKAGAWLLWPVEPTRYVADIAPRPFIMINGNQDKRIPTVSVEALYQAAREPKRLIWLDEGHITPRNPELLSRVLDAAAEALVDLSRKRLENVQGSGEDEPRGPSVTTVPPSLRTPAGGS
jgi:fermentation-respiration switch protein FrsA (DUF1100 family)